MKQPYQRHKAAKEAYEFMRDLYNILYSATKMDANGVKGIFIPRDVATPMVADIKAAAAKLQSLLEHWSSADTGDTAGDVEKTAAAIKASAPLRPQIHGGELSPVVKRMMDEEESLILGDTDGDTNSGGRDTGSPKRPKS